MLLPVPTIFEMQFASIESFQDMGPIDCRKPAIFDPDLLVTQPRGLIKRNTSHFGFLSLEHVEVNK